MTELLHIAATLIYLLAALLLAVAFSRGESRLTLASSIVVGLGLAVHAAALGAFGAFWGELPLVGLGPSLSTFAFLIGLGLLMAITIGHAATLGLVLVPLLVGLTAVALLVGLEPAGEPVAFQGAWIWTHVILALIGYAGLAVAFAAGLMYLLQFRELKSKHFGAVFRFFPPLETLDRLGRRGLLVGFPFLTLAVVLGWAWSARFADIAAPGASKLAWVIFTWFVFVAALASRAGHGRSGERGALASVIGFVAVIVAYVVLRIQGAPHGVFL